jgi:hypothetical protein
VQTFEVAQAIRPAIAALHLFYCFWQRAWSTRSRQLHHHRPVSLRLRVVEEEAAVVAASR